MVPVKSSIGLISSKISSRPDCSGTSLAPACRAASIRFRQRSLPSNQSNESVCRARRSGTSRGSLKRAKETRRVAELVAEALREAANRGPSELVAELSPHARETPADTPRGGSRKPRTSECSANCSIAEGHAARQLYLTMRFTVAPQHCSFWAKRQAHAAWSGDLGGVTNATVDSMCRTRSSWVKLRTCSSKPGALCWHPASRRADRACGPVSRCAGPAPRGPARHRPRSVPLLDGDGGAGALQGGLGLLRRFLVDPLQDRLGGAVHQVLGLLEAEAGQGPDLLDDLDLLLACGLEDDVELVLLLDLRLAAPRAHTATHSAPPPPPAPPAPPPPAPAAAGPPPATGAAALTSNVSSNCF